MRPPWNATWLGLPLLPFILAFWIAVFLHTLRYFRQGEEGSERAWLLAGIILAVVIGFILTPFGADPSGRYFLPLTVPLVFVAAQFISHLQGKYGVKAYGLAAMLVAYHLWGIGQSLLNSPHVLTTQFYEPARIDHRYDRFLIDFLLEHGETRGYSNYWVSYPLAFLSGEEVIFIPRLPYHPDFRKIRLLVFLPNVPLFQYSIIP